ncbi:hypothetical protein L873DRAFT_1691965, partial [Choiromyces venosus 120613-1]
IFNIDESGVRIECSTGEIVIVPIQVKELYTTSHENCKSLTIIETICTDGSQPLPSVIICPGEKIMENWIQDNLSRAEVMGLHHFIKHLGASPDEHWCILLLDSHITHYKDDFIIKYHENYIVPFQFPSHLTHVLQPLDVSIFRP